MKEFIVGRKGNVSQETVQVTVGTEEISRVHPAVLFVPRMEETNQKVGLAECTISLLSDVSKSMSPNPSRDYDKMQRGISEYDIPMNLVHGYREIGNILEYMANSASWRSGEMHQFDIIELHRRIDNLKFLIQNG